MKLSLFFILSVFFMWGCTKADKKSGSLADTFFEVVLTEPTDLHPLRANDLVGTMITKQNTYYGSAVFEKLITFDIDTNEIKPHLAESWSESKDKKSITFKIRKGVKFHNGEDLTAEDVKFSFDAIFDDKYEAFVARSYFSNFKAVEVVDAHTVKFIIKKPYFLNMHLIAGDFYVLPKNYYEAQSKDNRLSKEVVGTGPYKFVKWIKGKQIVLEENPDWWGRGLPEIGSKFNFKRYIFKFAKESTLRRAMLERGKADYEYRIREEDFKKKMTGPMWGKSVLKISAENQVPKNLSYIGLNNDHKIFKDKKVRKALAHLVNRAFINERFYYGMMDLAKGPFKVAGKYSNPSVKPMVFDPLKAKKLLSEAGWKDTDQDGLLDKVLDGVKTKLEFSLISSNKDSEKMLTVIKEDMKKAGVKMVINTTDWTALIKAKNEKKFDAIIMAWGGGYIDPDPTQIWHSKSAVGTGSNYISYKNPTVDKLIEEGIKISTSPKQRIEIYHEIQKRVAEDAPYIFLFEPKYQLYAVSSRVKRSKDTGRYSVGSMYWSLPSN